MQSVAVVHTEHPAVQLTHMLLPKIELMQVRHFKSELQVAQLVGHFWHNEVIVEITYPR